MELDMFKKYNFVGRKEMGDMTPSPNFNRPPILKRDLKVYPRYRNHN